ncbi:MAG: phosphotransferase [Proteobacteria bacterium]|nr:phosphotransferase [Pseudomonadota bacterium]
MPEESSEPFKHSASEALANWDIDVASLTLASRSENVVYKVTDVRGECYALRIHRPGYSSLVELESELQWTHRLSEGGVFTPTHILTRGGQGYASVPVAGQVHQVGVIKWLEGVALADRIENASVADVCHCFSQLGGLIAQTHRISNAWQTPPGFTRRVWNAGGLVGEAPLWGRFWEVAQLQPDEATLLKSARDEIFKRLSVLGEDPEYYGLIHADLHPFNVLVDGDRVQVIDFDDAGFGWHHHDVAVALYGSEDKPWGEAARDALFTGYRQVRPLHDSIPALLPLFTLIRSLTSLGWLNDRPELGRQAQMPRLIGTIVEQIDDVLDLKITTGFQS